MVDAAPVVATDPFTGLATGAAQLAALCARGNSDVASTAFCSPTAKPITGLADVQTMLGLAFASTTANSYNGAGGNPAFALSAHSESLLLRDVSAANPRVILMTAPGGWKPDQNIARDSTTASTPPPGWNPPFGPGSPTPFPCEHSWSKPSEWTPPTSASVHGAAGSLAAWPPGTTNAWGDFSASVQSPAANPPDTSFVAISYARGEPLLEIAAFDATIMDVRFFLVHYTPSCSGSTCTAGDLFTPAVESNWTNVSIYEDTDLANTTLDCTQCHQPAGAGTKKILRMQEAAFPWSHWMSQWTGGGEALLSDFHSVHGTTESYGGVPAALIDKSEPMTLELFVNANLFQNQPNAFQSLAIEGEVFTSASGQPNDNSQAGASATWQGLYTSALTGTFIAVPYHDVKITDPGRLFSAATGYQAFLTSGDPTQVLDLANLYPPTAQVDLGMTPAATATSDQMIGQMCVQCHNSTTDQTLTRAKFDATNLAGMSATEKALAIERLNLGADDIKLMPPARMRTLSAAQIAAITAELQQ